MDEMKKVKDKLLVINVSSEFIVESDGLTAYWQRFKV
jgi:hypothetical protein